MRDGGRGAGALGDRDGGGCGDGGVVTQARAGGAGHGRLGKEPVDGDLEHEAVQRPAPGAHDRLADRAHPQRLRAAGLVEMVEQAAREIGVALQHGDDLRRCGVGVLDGGDDPLDRCVEHRQQGQLVDRGGETVLDLGIDGVAPPHAIHCAQMCLHGSRMGRSARARLRPSRARGRMEE